MAEQIMWAVKGPDNEFVSVGDASLEAWANAAELTGHRKHALELDGYRCVPVRITEVPNA